MTHDEILSIIQTTYGTMICGLNNSIYQNFYYSVRKISDNCLYLTFYDDNIECIINQLKVEDDKDQCAIAIIVDGIEKSYTVCLQRHKDISDLLF